jgi:hypothetical protein
MTLLGGWVYLPAAPILATILPLDPSPHHLGSIIKVLFSLSPYATTNYPSYRVLIC